MKKNTDRKSHLDRFLFSNPSLRRLEDSLYKDLLEWAEKLDFISFIVFEGVKLYDQSMVDTALMWKTKYKDGVDIS